MKLLASNGLVSRSEYGEAKSVLDAAALTDLAAAAGAILQLLYYIMLVRAWAPAEPARLAQGWPKFGDSDELRPAFPGAGRGV